MKTKPDPMVGDTVQIRKATHDGPIWIDATVAHYDNFKIVVVYGDSRRESIPHEEGRWRRAQ